MKQLTNLPDVMTVWVYDNNTSYFELARRAGVPHPYVYRIKNGEPDAVPMTAKAKIAKALGLDYEFKLVYKGQDNKPSVDIVVYRIAETGTETETHD